MANILREKVLVLNKNWMIIGTCTVRKALTLMTTPIANGNYKASAIDSNMSIYDFDAWKKMPAEEPCIHSPSSKFKIPTAIVVRCEIIPKINPNFSRKAVIKRDQGICGYCGCQTTTRNISIDHIIPKSKGGKNDWLNTIVACTKCNSKKGNLTLIEANMKLIRKPYRPSIVIPEGKVPELWHKLGFKH